jgi:hypothetical protein
LKTQARVRPAKKLEEAAAERFLKKSSGNVFFRLTEALMAGLFIENPAFITNLPQTP